MVVLIKIAKYFPSIVKVIWLILNVTIELSKKNRRPTFLFPRKKTFFAIFQTVQLQFNISF